MDKLRSWLLEAEEAVGKAAPDRTLAEEAQVAVSNVGQSSSSQLPLPMR